MKDGVKLKQPNCIFCSGGNDLSPFISSL